MKLLLAMFVALLGLVPPASAAPLLVQFSGTVSGTPGAEFRFPSSVTAGDLITGSFLYDPSTPLSSDSASTLFLITAQASIDGTPLVPTGGTLQARNDIGEGYSVAVDVQRPSDYPLYTADDCLLFYAPADCGGDAICETVVQQQQDQCEANPGIDLMNQWSLQLRFLLPLGEVPDLTFPEDLTGFASTQWTLGTSFSRLSGSIDSIEVTGTAVPEPGSLALVGGALAGFAVLSRRGRSARQRWPQAHATLVAA